MAPMRVGRNYHAACALARRYIFVSGTLVKDKPYDRAKTCELFDSDTNTWTDLPDLRNPYAMHTCCATDPYVLYVF